MYIETRFYDNGKAYAKLHKGFSYPALEEDDCCDRYVESVGNSKVLVEYDNGCDYESLDHWIEEMGIELDDVVGMILSLENGELVDISAYC